MKYRAVNLNVWVVVPASLLFVVSAAGQATGSIAGAVVDDTGAAVANAVVGAYLQIQTQGSGFPVVRNAQTGSDGKFTFDGLSNGTYQLCVDRQDAAILNPCHWSSNPPTATVAGGTATRGVSLGVQRAIVLNIRVNDPLNVVAANPNSNDLLIGLAPVNGPFLPARLASTDSQGRSFTLSVPPGQPVSVLVYSRNLSLADGAGNAFASANSSVSLVSAALGTASAPNGSSVPAVTIAVTGLATATPTTTTAPQHVKELP